MANNNRPHEIRLGRVKAVLWPNAGEHGTRYNVKFSRIYRDKQGAWQASDSFDRDDLPLLEKVADQAHRWIFEQAPSASDQPPAADPDGTAA